MRKRNPPRRCLREMVTVFMIRQVFFSDIFYDISRDCRSYFSREWLKKRDPCRITSIRSGPSLFSSQFSSQYLGLCEETISPKDQSLSSFCFIFIASENVANQLTRSKKCVGAPKSRWKKCSETLIFRWKKCEHHVIRLDNAL